MRPCMIQLIILKLYYTTGMAKVLIASILLAKFNSVFNIALALLTLFTYLFFHITMLYSISFVDS